MSDKNKEKSQPKWEKFRKIERVEEQKKQSDSKPVEKGKPVSQRPKEGEK